MISAFYLIYISAEKTKMRKFRVDLLFSVENTFIVVDGRTIRVIERSDYLKSDPVEQNLVPTVAQL